MAKKDFISRKPRILYWDLETSPMILASFGLYDQNHRYDDVYKDWFIICAQYQWEGESKIHSISVLDNPKFNKNPQDDYHIVKKLHQLLSEADIIVAHNGDSFDFKKFMAKVIEHKLPPLKLPKMIDTLKAARKFGFTSKKLDDLNKRLGLVQKLQADRGSWPKAALGDRKAIESIVRYGKGDIPALRELYMRLRPYMEIHPNMNLFSEGEDCCPNCGSKHFQKRGFFQSSLTQQFQRYQCKNTKCGKWFKGKKATVKVDLR